MDTSLCEGHSKFSFKTVNSQKWMILYTIEDLVVTHNLKNSLVKDGQL